MKQYPLDPFELFYDWYNQAAGKRLDSVKGLHRLWYEIMRLVRKLIGHFYPPLSMHQPDSMVLSSATLEGVPSSRVVLFKGVIDKQVVFYTNYDSRKGKELLANPRAALLFHWGLPERQVRFEGRVEKVSREESEAYWDSRPRGSQLSGTASLQSSEIANRDELRKRVQQLEEEFQGKPIPCPENWGGFQFMPENIEFWEGKAHRLHLRVLYRKKGNSYDQVQLSP